MWHASGTTGDGDLGFGLVVMAPATMAFLRQLMATHGNGFRLSEPFSTLPHLPPVATGCNRSAPLTLHPRATASAPERRPLR
jgi:hypothetical protein